MKPRYIPIFRKCFVCDDEISSSQFMVQHLYKTHRWFGDEFMSTLSTKKKRLFVISEEATTPQNIAEDFIIKMFHYSFNLLTFQTQKKKYKYCCLCRYDVNFEDYPNHIDEVHISEVRNDLSATNDVSAQVFDVSNLDIQDFENKLIVLTNEGNMLNASTDYQNKYKRNLHTSYQIVKNREQHTDFMSKISNESINNEEQDKRNIHTHVHADENQELNADTENELTIVACNENNILNDSINYKKGEKPNTNTSYQVETRSDTDDDDDDKDKKNDDYDNDDVEFLLLTKEEWEFDRMTKDENDEEVESSLEEYIEEDEIFALPFNNKEIRIQLQRIDDYSP